MDINFEIVKGFFKSKFFKYLLTAIIIIIIITIILAPFKSIETGECGIVYNNLTGKINDDYIKSGWHFIMPFIHKLTVYPLTDRTYNISRTDKTWMEGRDTSIWIPTNDNYQISIDFNCTYHLLENKIGSIYNKFNDMTISEIENEYLDRIFRYVLLSILTQNSAIDIYSHKRQVIQDNIFKILNEKLNSIGIEIDMVFLKEVRLPSEITSLIAADARSKATLIEAQAQSESNKIIGKSLDENFIKSQAIDKLSSGIKLIIVPANTSGKIDYDKIIEQVVGK